LCQVIWLWSVASIHYLYEGEGRAVFEAGKKLAISAAFPRDRYAGEHAGWHVFLIAWARLPVRPRRTSPQNSHAIFNVSNA